MIVTPVSSAQAGQASAAPRMDAPPLGGQPGSAGASAPASPDAWLMMGYDLKNSYFNPAEHTLSRANAPQLVELWRTKLATMPTGSPLIAEGKVFTTASDATHALDLETGAKIWSRTDLAATSSLAYEDGYLYLQTFSPARVYKLKADTGESVWGPAAPFDPDNASGMSSPIVAAGLVLVGHESGLLEVSLDPSARAAARGGVEAFDAATGRKAWTYYTSDPKQQEDGASVWSSVSVDLATSTLYATTGNNFNVVGPNSDAVHAIDLKTGTRRWVKQVRAGDLSFTTTQEPAQDTDFGANPILAELAGKRVVAAGDKAGTFWALDRDTGEILWSRAGLSPNTLANQHGGVFINGAFDGEYFYVVSNTASPGGVLHKLDPSRAGQSVWTHAFDQLTWAALSLANGLLLAPVDSVLYILDTNTGEVLAHFETGGTIAGGAAAIAQGRIVVKSGLVYIDATNKPNDEIICYGLPRTAPPATGAAGAAPPPPPAAGFSAVYRDVIAANGCATGQCHSTTVAGGLSLRDADTAYSSLVGVRAMGTNACASSGLMRVAPADPEHSLLVMKLEHTQTCGSPMPPAGGPLNAAQLQAVRSWIATGAGR